MDIGLCGQAEESGLDQYGALENFNTDQDSQVTSQAATNRLAGRRIRIRMNGTGAWRLV